MVEIKLIRNDQQELILDGTTWGILAIEGIDYPTIEFFTKENAIGDGSQLVGQRLTEREITVVAKLKDQNLNQTIRQPTISFFNNKFTYKLYVTYQGVTKWIDCYITAFRLPSENIYKAPTLTFSMTSLNPYFNSVDNYGENINEVVGMFSFPYLVEVGDTFEVSVFSFSSTVTIVNNGDADTNMIATFIATGAVENPKIINGTGYVEVLDTMVANDVVVMDFVNLTVTKNGTNIMNKVNKMSTFTDMELVVGENFISFDATTGTNNLNVNITFYEQYGGM